MELPYKLTLVFQNPCCYRSERGPWRCLGVQTHIQKVFGRLGYIGSCVTGCPFFEGDFMSPFLQITKDFIPVHLKGLED